MNSAPLSGITIVSLEHAIAAPLCTRQLAELGARVIKIERRETGDFARHYDDRVKGQSSHFIWTNRSKLSMTLDLKHELAPSILDKLLSEADVFVQNLAPGAVKKMGLSYSDLHTQHPNLIVCNISGYGDEGPYKSKKAYDLLVQAEAGFLSITGTDEVMTKSGISIADIAAGMQAHSAILAALIQRSKTGEGSRIDISMLEAMVEWMGFPLYYAYEGASPPARSGADHASIYPYGAFNTTDNKVIMLGLQNEREWESFCRDVLADESLIADSRFENNALRSGNREELRDIIQTLFSTLNAEEIIKKLEAAQIAFANVNDMQDVWNHPQLKALNRIIETETPQGTVKSLKPPGNNSSYESSLGSVPALGEQTREILESLGFEAGEIENFYTEGVV
ncbi:MAG: CoA transferase [SAR86 cluster bacterium]|uniref:CoA transferase n=1 Tax=SAR86 cluster bacterium TaxID=2030880 RepID=A0A2A5ADZ6_9GAMM|nr:MAG: CoA transferase [SAR86 cluster bacterium]